MFVLFNSTQVISDYSCGCVIRGEASYGLHRLVIILLDVVNYTDTILLLNVDHHKTSKKSLVSLTRINKTAKAEEIRIKFMF